jgi:DNA-binding MarR family transcriptional regulator
MVTAKAHPRMPKPQLENVDPLTASVFHALGRVMHLNRLVMMRTVCQRGVQPPEAFALALLRDHDGVTQRELASILHLSRPRVSVILSSLEESGAVTRRPDESDRRLTRVFLTPEGHRREQEHRVVLGEYVDRTIGALSEDERRDLERLRSRLAERIRDVLREAVGSGGSERGASKKEEDPSHP